MSKLNDVFRVWREAEVLQQMFMPVTTREFGTGMEFHLLGIGNALRRTLQQSPTSRAIAEPFSASTSLSSVAEAEFLKLKDWLREKFGDYEEFN